MKQIKIILQNNLVISIFVQTYYSYPFGSEIALFCEDIKVLALTKEKAKLI
jgi:hypothetical protein